MIYFDLFNTFLCSDMFAVIDYVVSQEKLQHEFNIQNIVVVRAANFESTYSGHEPKQIELVYLISIRANFRSIQPNSFGLWDKMG